LEGREADSQHGESTVKSGLRRGGSCNAKYLTISVPPNLDVLY
jgi:hypothetical protein